MGISLDEFWGDPSDIHTGMTLREFDLCSQGYHERIKTSQELLAWHAANLINGSGMTKRKVTPDKLLGRDGDKVTASDLRAQLSRQSEKMKKNLLDEIGEINKTVDYEEYEKDYDRWMDEIYSSVDS